MDKPLDIFRIVPEGVRWMASVEDLQVAKALIKAKTAEQPGDFLVASIVTGWKMESRLREPPPKTRSVRVLPYVGCQLLVSRLTEDVK